MPGGVATFDCNNDGRADIFFTNGAEIPSLEKSAPKYSNRLFRNDGEMKFTDVTKAAGLSGRGYSVSASVTDFDNDGKLDIVLSSLNDPAELWHNESPGSGHWLNIRLVGKRSNRDGIGALQPLGSPWLPCVSG